MRKKWLPFSRRGHDAIVDCQGLLGGAVPSKFARLLQPTGAELAAKIFVSSPVTVVTPLTGICRINCTPSSSVPIVRTRKSSV